MKVVTAIGILLIVLGVISLVFQGITYKTKEDVINIGPIHATSEEKKTIPIHPVFGGILLTGGIILLASARRKQ